MAISAEELNIILSAKDKQFNKAMDRANKKIERFSRQSQKRFNVATKAMDKFTKAAGGLGVVLSVGAVATGFTRLIDNATRSAQEIQNLSTLAGTSVERFQELSFASQSFGISQEKLADILKDVNDRVGDFVSTQGGGAMADFFERIAPKVGLTAEAFKGLSSDEALGLYVKALDEANVNQAELTFFMEALASDATLLAPLFRNNANELNNLTARARELGVVLDADIITNGARLRRHWDELLTVMGARFAGFALEIVEGFDKIFEVTDRGVLLNLEEQLKREVGILNTMTELEARLASGQQPKGAKTTLNQQTIAVMHQRAIERTKEQEKVVESLTNDIEDLKKAEADRLEIMAKFAAMSQGQGAFPDIKVPNSKDIKAANNELLIMLPMMEELDSIASTLEKSFEDVFMSAIEGSNSFKDTLRSSAQAIIRELYRVLVVQRLVNAAMGFFGGSIPTPPAPLQIGNLAAGGYMQAGQAAVVGEHGREIFVPSQSGRVLSVGQAQSAISGGDGVTINQTINVTTGVQQTVRNEIKTLLPQIAESAKAAVVDSKRRGGSYGRAFS